MQLNNKTALVTGGGRGIGQGIAVALAKAGARVAIADLDIAIARETATQVEAHGGRSASFQVDISDDSEVKQLVTDVVSEFGQLDIAVNNAGIISIQSIDELAADDWDRVMAINAKGVFLCTQAELTVMRPRGFGRIINIASIAGKIGFPNLSHYSASKFAVIGFTNAVAKEVATEGVTVNALCPGIVGTEMWRGEGSLSDHWRCDGESEVESWERHQKTLLPQGVAQTPEDMGQLAVYLASAEHVTGQAIAVDGGFSL